MIEWHNAQTESPPVGQILLLNHIDHQGNDWVDHGFYAKQDTRDDDFTPDCLNILTCLSGENTFYRYYAKKGISLPSANFVISWAIAT